MKCQRKIPNKFLAYGDKEKDFEKILNVRKMLLSVDYRPLSIEIQHIHVFETQAWLCSFQAV